MTARRGPTAPRPPNIRPTAPPRERAGRTAAPPRTRDDAAAARSADRPSDPPAPDPAGELLAFGGTLLREARARGIVVRRCGRRGTSFVGLDRTSPFGMRLRAYAPMVRMALEAEAAGRARFAPQPRGATAPVGLDPFALADLALAAHDVAERMRRANVAMLRALAARFRGDDPELATALDAFADAPSARARRTVERRLRAARTRAYLEPLRPLVGDATVLAALQRRFERVLARLVR